MVNVLLSFPHTPVTQFCEIGWGTVEVPEVESKLTHSFEQFFLRDFDEVWPRVLRDFGEAPVEGFARLWRGFGRCLSEGLAMIFRDFGESCGEGLARV